MPGKINNGLLNDMKNELFQVYVFSPVFPMTFSRYRLLLFLFHSLEVHFMNSYNNDHMFVAPLSTGTYRLKMWVRILENKNVGYKSICMPGKINNGLLNDMKNELFQVYVYSPVFPMTFSRYRLLLFLFHSLEVHFMNSYNDHMFVGPLSIKTKHISRALKT